MDFAKFKNNIENLLGRQLSNEEMVELCGEALITLLKQALVKEGQNATSNNQTV